MVQVLTSSDVPMSENVLRDLARNVSEILPRFDTDDSASSVKQLYSILAPIFETAELALLSTAHRAAASNALCAIVEACQSSAAGCARKVILEDGIWLRLFNVYLQKSDEAKGKSMRQMLLLLTSTITKDQSQRAMDLRTRATTTFLEIICARQDRLKVKPALQGLAHFLLRDVVLIPEIITIFSALQGDILATVNARRPNQMMFRAILAWVVHHDTSLSAGHLIKNFLLQARKQPEYIVTERQGSTIPFWIIPTIEVLQVWPDRMQEFRTHVFPYCFLPDIGEYQHFLTQLRFDAHVEFKGGIPHELRSPPHLNNGLSEEEEFQILLAALETGKQLTILRDSDYRELKTVSIHDGAIHMPDDVFGKWISHPIAEVRLAGMFLSVHSTSVTKPLTGGVLKSLRRNLTHLHTETDANLRREIHGYTQKLFDRLRASTATLSKSALKTRPSTTSRLSFPTSCFDSGTPHLVRERREPLLESLSFISWYKQFLIEELRSTANYQRRITALQCIIIVLRSGLDPGVPHAQLSKAAQGQLQWAHELHVADDRLIRVLLDLILDPFDDIRASTIAVLQLCIATLSDCKRRSVIALIPAFIDRAELAMLKTGRADQADGVARAYSLLYSTSNAKLSYGPDFDRHPSSDITVFKKLCYQLSSTLEIARDDLSRAVDGRPVHGTFAALRYIIDSDGFYPTIKTCSTEELLQYKSSHDSIIDGIESLWLYVYHILCADAPEGHVPDEIDEEASLDTKEILSYSWRGLKEASVLLRTIISKAPIGIEAHDILSIQAFERLGQLCFTQLLELRHRGAFSTVSQTFAAFCRRCITSTIPTIRALSETWYKDTIGSIQAKAGAITRRSAGIPALMAAIVAADPKMFPRALKDLIAESLAEAQSLNIEESRLPQVHAMNCIKEFFTTSRLSVISEAHIGEGLELAAEMLNSNIWPIRNCSLMLFKALIERLLGSDEAQDWKDQQRTKTSRFSYDDYPSLVGILTDLLDPEGALKESIEQAPTEGSPLDLHGAEGVFPALQILRQARPPQDSLPPIIASIEKLLGSPHWHLRDMAARTLVSLYSTNELYRAACILLKKTTRSHNAKHGTLLAAKYLVWKFFQSAASNTTIAPQDLMTELSLASKEWYMSNDCPSVRAAFLDIVSTCGFALLERGDATELMPAWIAMTETVDLGPTFALTTSTQVADALLRESLAQGFMIDRVILRDGTVGQLTSERYQDIGEALTHLSTEDPDTCCAALDSLHSILKLEVNNGLTIPLDQIVVHVHNVLLNSIDAEVISRAQNVLANGLTTPSIREGLFSMTAEDQVLSTIPRLEAQCVDGPPSNMQSALHLLGYFLDFAYQKYPAQRQEMYKFIAHYIRLLRMTIIDTNPFDMRFAAVQSLGALSNIWTMSTKSKATAPLILAFSCILYDLLNDDDDEVRDLSALATGNLLRAQVNSQIQDTVPILTGHRLTSWLSTTFATSSDLQHEALRRLTNTPSPTPLFNSPFAKTFHQERKQDTALFATEKQNLYKDDTLDAVLWARVLCSLNPPDAQAATALVSWVFDGLNILTGTAEQERDDALGWASKAEVFTLGMRVVCGAEVVLIWSRGGRVECGPGKRMEVLVALKKFGDVGRERGLHGLWIKKVDRVLEKEVVGMLKSVMGSLVALEK